MNQRQKDMSFIFDSHPLEKKMVRTSMFAAKSQHWVMTAKDKTDLARIKECLERNYFTDKHFNVRGLEVIFTEHGEYSLLRSKHEHEVESNPRWLDYDQFTHPGINLEFKPYDTNVVFYPINGFTAIEYQNRDAYERSGHDGTIMQKREEQSIAKFHISIHREDIAKAWDTISQYLIENEINCKVISQAGAEAMPEISNKSIVLYVQRKNIQDLERWQRVLTDIETMLVANHVRDGGGIESDRPVEGSRFFHLRYGNTHYDREAGTQSKWDEDLRLINGGVDSFADLKINVTEEQAKRFQTQEAARPRIAAEHTRP